MKRLLLISLFMFWAHGAAVAASAVIVDSAYVADALKRNAILWDVRPADAYAKGHVPGAISIGDAAKVLRHDNTERVHARSGLSKSHLRFQPTAAPSTLYVQRY